MQNIERRFQALEKIDKRELAALERDNKRHERVRTRGDDGSMPSLAQIAGIDDKKRENAAPDLLKAFEKAKQPNQDAAPDLMAAFGRAAKERDENKEGNGSGSCLENARPPDMGSQERHDKDRDRGRE